MEREGWRREIGIVGRWNEGIGVGWDFWKY